MRLREVLRRGVDVAAGELLLVGKRDGVDQEIERAPGRLHAAKAASMEAVVGHVALADDQPVDLLGKRLDPLLQRSPW